MAGWPAVAIMERPPIEHTAWFFNFSVPSCPATTIQTTIYNANSIADDRTKFRTLSHILRCSYYYSSSNATITVPWVHVVPTRCGIDQHVSFSLRYLRPNMPDGSWVATRTPAIRCKLQDVIHWATLTSSCADVLFLKNRQLRRNNRLVLHLSNVKVSCTFFHALQAMPSFLQGELNRLWGRHRKYPPATACETCSGSSHRWKNQHVSPLAGRAMEPTSPNLPATKTPATDGASL